MFFADELMMFGEATEQQMVNVMRCMDMFSINSSLKINFNKSLIYCSPNTCARTKRRIGEISGITVMENISKYLGIPILQKRVSKNTFGYILENMRKKLVSWKTESLSLAGRRVLTQSALATILVYSMQAMALPKGTCEEIDRTCRSFLWGDSREKKKDAFGQLG